MTASTITIDTFLQNIPEHVRDASRYCAAPSWFQKPLALKIIENFVKTDSSAHDTLYQVLDLPFVYRHDETTWRFTEDAREEMLGSLPPDDYKKVHRLVATELEAQVVTLLHEGHADLPEGNVQTDTDSWQIRRLRWQLVYHLAPVDSQQAFKEFEEIAKWAIGNRDRLPMFKLAIEAWQKQAKWLNVYGDEGSYYQGYYAYRTEDFARSEQFFDLVWRSFSKNIFMKADSGHLLGVIYRRKGQNSWIERAERILKASLELLPKEMDHNDKETLELMARILNSLGATLVQRAKSVDKAQALRKLEEAENILRQSLRLQNEILNDDRGRAHVLNTFATLHLQYVHLHLGNERVHLVRADEYIEEALSWSLESGSDRDQTVQLNTKADVLIQMGGKKDLEIAEELALRSLDLNKRIHDEKTNAISSFRLAEVYSKRDDNESLDLSIKWAKRSLDLWQKLEHPLGQKEAIALVAITCDRLGDPGRASRWRRLYFKLEG